MEAENFSRAAILFSDLTITANRAEAALIALRAMEDEEVVELDREAIERLLKRLQRDLKASVSKENSPAFLRVFEDFRNVLNSELNRRIESEGRKRFSPAC